MVAALPRVAPSLQIDSIMPVARGIMTTDRYPKVASRELPGGARIVGIAKGAGMIEPNMATMLGFILTDADLPCERAELQQALASAASRSFNCVSIDGDESTSDTLALLASRRRPCTSMDSFRENLDAVCRDLAAQVVRNGEGTRHVIRVAVSGAEDEAMARRVGHAVVNGPLFKSAVAGNDPNVGRLVGKVGQSLGRAGAQLADGCVCSIGGEVIFEKGRFTLDQAKEERLSAHLRAAVQDTGLAYPQHQRVVDVQVQLGGGGQGAAVVLGSDLTDEYVAINGDYRS
jgi:glutamate N-acetyltransferase/amino-acid N-acetyltransferase